MQIELVETAVKDDTIDNNAETINSNCDEHIIDDKVQTVEHIDEDELIIKDDIDNDCFEEVDRIGEIEKTVKCYCHENLRTILNDFS